MKLICIALLGLGLSAVQVSARQATPAKPGQAAPAKGPQAASPLKTEKDKVSYGIGVQFGSSLKSQGVDIDPDMLAKGLKDATTGAKLLMTEEDMRQILTAFQEEMKLKQEEALTALGIANQKASDAFFAENGKKPDVVALPDGLQYTIVKAATGAKPTDADTVVLQYRGTLLNGTEFDSSFSTGQPATFQVRGLIPGFREALLLMPVGSTYKFFIPPDLAYGPNGAGDVIGPNAALIFQIDLISIEPKAAGAPQGAPPNAPR